MDWLQLAVLILCVGAFCWWMSGFSVRNRDAYKKYVEAVKLDEGRWSAYREGLEAPKESNRIRIEELALLRELIAELRASRQAPGQRPSPPADSN
jgi:hypothetical protein